MLNNKKIWTIGAAMLLTALAVAPAVQAGYERPPAEMATVFDGLRLRPGYDLLTPGVELAATASVAPSLQVAVPVRRSAPSYNVFRSVVVPVGKLAAFAQWNKVQPAAATARGFCASSACEGGRGRKLAILVEKARGLSQVEALTLVNREVNRLISYRADRGDQWQTLAQSVARGTGDCEDFAIAKMTLLAELGFAPEQLQFIVLKDTRRQLYHAVLAVHVEGKRYILDNLSNTAASDDIFRTYKPIVSFVGTKSYVHGFKGGETAVAVGAGEYEGIRLGEGN